MAMSNMIPDQVVIKNKKAHRNTKLVYVNTELSCIICLGVSTFPFLKISIKIMQLLLL